MAVLKNIGSKSSPVDLGHGVLAYKQNGLWLYRNSGDKGRKLTLATDAELILELEKRGLTVVFPPHECVDRPGLPCPACQRDSLRALGLLKVC